MLPERFLDKFVPEPNTGCWLWLAQVSRDGYGKFKYIGGQLAHRFAYETARGPVPEGLELDHLCRQRSCVNPDHLEAVTRRENARRGLRGSLTTHCPHGHEYTPENTYSNPKGGRVCRACRSLDWQRRRDARPKRAPKTHCAKGHDYSVTAYIYRGKRFCRACKNAATRIRRARGS
jgi:hypothetical protein